MQPCMKDEKIIVRDLFRALGGEIGCLKFSDHRVVERLEFHSLLSTGQYKHTITIGPKLFISVYAPDWWEGYMYEPLRVLDNRMSHIRSACGSDSDYRDYILDKNKIINMQEQLEVEKRLIDKFKP